MQAVGTATPGGASVWMEQVWDRTVAFVHAQRRTLIPLAALTIVLPEVIVAIVAAGWGQEGGATGAAVRLLGYVVAVLVLWGELVVVAMAAGPASARAARRQATLRLPVVIGFVLLLSLVLLLVSIPGVAILAAYGFDFAAALAGEVIAPRPVAAAWIALYGLLLLPVLLWIGARLSLVVPVAVMERRGLNAVSRSWALTRGLAARILGMVLLYAVVSGVLTMAARFAGGSVFALIFGGDAGLGAASVLTLLLVATVRGAMTVLLWAFTATLYGAAREQLDGTAAHR
ncbi:hypothetical protein ACBY01_02175 [Sphingomonas sp. ac-8]|uniref:hypothetical protein n=1 Tax=Sphingomonas sp. ac-8 TaxID=3242977 RepID=UPI003A7FEF0F